MSTEAPRKIPTGPVFKVQISGQHLRFRLDESALARLLAGETLRDCTRLGADRVFTRSLGLGAGSEASFSSDGNHWQLALPRTAVNDYVARLPCREALAFALDLAPDVRLAIDFEVDVRDSRRAGRKKSAKQDNHGDL